MQCTARFSDNHLKTGPLAGKQLILFPSNLLEGPVINCLLFLNSELDIKFAR